MFPNALTAFLLAALACATAQARTPDPWEGAAAGDSTAPAPLFRGQSALPGKHPEPASTYSEADVAGVAPDMVGDAYLWAVLGTVIPISAAYLISSTSRSDASNSLVSVLTVSGALFGPSAGQFYARSPGQAMLGFGIRSLGTVITGVGLVTLLSDAFCGFGETDEDTPRNCSDHGGGFIAVGGLLTYVGGVVYSFVDTRTAVYRYRSRLSDSGFGVAPLIGPGRDGDLKAGALAYYHF